MTDAEWRAQVEQVVREMEPWLSVMPNCAVIAKFRDRLAALLTVSSPRKDFGVYSPEVERELSENYAPCSSFGPNVSAAPRAEAAPVSPPIESIRAAAGLVASERNRWEHAQSPEAHRTHDHWQAVHAALAGYLLAVDVTGDVARAEAAASSPTTEIAAAQNAKRTLELLNNPDELEALKAGLADVAAGRVAPKKEP